MKTPDVNRMEMGPEVEVPKPLDQTQVDFYVDNGYLVVPDMVSTKEQEEIAAEMVAVARGAYPCRAIEPAPAHYSDRQVMESLLCIHHPQHVSPVIEKYVRHPQICGALSQIAGAHLLEWDGSVECMQAMYFVKPPGFQGQAWHQDEVYIPTRDRSLVGAWIAIDDATKENGCLFILPGSHRKGYLYPQKEHENPDEFDSALESYGFDDSSEVPVEVKAGTLVFFNGYLLHHSYKNRSDIYRRVLVNHYCNSWSLLPWQLKEGESVAKSDFRGVMQVAGSDPYAWKGYESHPEFLHVRSCKAAEEARVALQQRGGSNTDGH